MDTHSIPLHPTSATHQKAWDLLRVTAMYEGFLEAATDPSSRGQLLAVHSRESEAWLHTLPMSSLGLQMDNETICVAIGLHLGVTLCRPHVCHLCGASVHSLGSHGLH